MGKRVYLVIEGELPWYYNAYVPHGVFSDKQAADEYRDGLVQDNQAPRWENAAVMEFEVDDPGHIEQRRREFP